MSPTIQAMEEIWQSTSQQAADGKRYILLEGKPALAFLYLTGFVDVKKHSLKNWMEAFKKSLQKDGSYRVTHDQWLEKKKFRYEGPTGVPFDPEGIEEKEYTEQELIVLLKEKILPNTILEESGLPRVLNSLKAKKRLVGGRFKMDREAKDEIKDLLNKYPSPPRVREVMVQTLKKSKEAALKKGQQSRFTSGSAMEKIVKNRLSEVSKVLGSETVPPLPDAPTISLKDLQKKKTPPGGGRV